MSTSEDREPQGIEKGYGEGKDQTVVYNAHVDVSAVNEEKLVQKIDWRLLPWLSLLYLLSFLDRTSIGNAKVLRLVLLPRSAFTGVSTALPSNDRPTPQRQRIPIMPHNLLLLLRPL